MWPAVEAVEHRLVLGDRDTARRFGHRPQVGVAPAASDDVQLAARDILERRTRSSISV